MRQGMMMVSTVLLLMLAGTATAATLSVAVKEGPLRATATPFGRIVTTLHYGDQVSVLQRQGAWVRVKSGSSSGWLHASTLSEKRLALQAGQGTVRSGASTEELTLAGKGFNAEVEGEFRQRNSALDFRWVERMEAMKVAPDELQRFVRDGQLGSGGTP